jgi:sugar diacid utilization regulator
MGQQLAVADVELVQPTGDTMVPASVYRAAVRAFGDAAGVLNTTEDPDVMLHLIARNLCSLIGVKRSSIYLRDEKTGLFNGQVLHQLGATEEADGAVDAQIKRLIAGTAADGFTSEIIRTLAPVAVADAQEDPRPVRATMRAWNIRSILGVPMILDGEVIGIIFCDDGMTRSFSEEARELASTFADLAAVAIAQAKTTARLRKSVRTVARQNTLLRRATEMDDRLTELVLEGGSLQEIAEAVAELTGKPCEIYDRDHRRLAGAIPAWIQDKVASRLLDKAVRRHPVVAAALAELGEKGSGVIGPAPAAGLNRRCLLAPITTREGTWGSLIVMEYGTRFGPLDLHIARRAATNAALELAAERRAARAEVDARASLAADLVRGSAEPAAITRRAEYLGMDLAAPHVLGLVGVAGATAGDLPPATAIAEALADAGVDEPILATGVAEGVLVVLPLATDAAPREAVRAVRARFETALASLQHDVLLTAGLSTPCHGSGDYRRAYTEARQVLDCLRSLASERRDVVLAADDLGPGRLFLASSSREDADRFAQDALGVLLDRDQEVMVDLLSTLHVFFESARSVRRSAQALGVHENTIRYRLARVDELTGLAVGSSSDDQLTIQLALLILRLQGWALGPRPGAAVEGAAPAELEAGPAGAVVAA